MSRILTTFKIAGVLLCLLALSVPAYAGTNKKKKKVKAVVVQTLDDGTICAQTKKGKWLAVKQTKKGAYKKIRSKKKKKHCQEGFKDVETVSRFENIPNLGDLLAENVETSSFALNQILAVAPSLGEIQTAKQEESIKQFFFPAGVVEAINSGSPSTEQCRQFFDGMAACHMAQSTGHTMEQILHSGTSMCYMKNMPGADGGVTLASGKGSKKNIFVSDAKEKLVKINFVADIEQNEEERGAEDIFIKIHSLSSNQANGDQYHATLLFCQENPQTGEKTAIGAEDIRVTDQGQLLLSSQHNERRFGASNATITAGLTKNEAGEFEFDPNQGKAATLAFSGSAEGPDDEEGPGEDGPPQNQVETFAVKASVVSTPDGILKTKMKDNFGVHHADRYVVSSIEEGNGLSDLRFLAGAVKDQVSVNNEIIHSFLTGTEWNGDRYERVEDGDLVEEVDITFSEDPFFAENPAPEFDAPFDCATAESTKTHQVDLDMSHPGFQDVVEQCETHHVEGMDFCRASQEDESEDSVNEHNAWENCEPEE